MKIITEDVEKAYPDSSDEEHHQDKIFQYASHELTQQLIDNLTEDQIDKLNENIRDLNYEKGLRAYGKEHRLGARELFNKVSNMPKINTTQMLKTLNGFHTEKVPPIQLSKFELNSTKSRLIKFNEKTSRKLYDLEAHDVLNECVDHDDTSINEKKTGLPEVNKFY
jgi:hypothetical protein